MSWRSGAASVPQERQSSKDRQAAKERQEKTLELISSTARWYDKDHTVREGLAKVALQMASACPSRIHAICESLLKALSSGTEDPSGAFLHIGGRTFHSREDLNAEVKQLLRRYQDDAYLDDVDARFMHELLPFHPKGEEKAKGCQAVSAGQHPRFARRCFFIVRADGREDFSYVRCVDNAHTSEIIAQQQICETLCAILQLHPAACEKTARFIEEKFPPTAGKMGTVERHRNWTRSVLFLCSKIHQLTEFLLLVLIRRMVEIDVTMHKMEEEHQPDQAAVLGDKHVEETTVIDHMANILDAKMMLMLEFLQKKLDRTVGEAENQLVKSLLSVFEGTVLLTHKVKCVQFLWFYLSSLRPAWAEAFLSVLLQTAYSPEYGNAKRVISFAYLASFVSRASFLTIKYALRTAQYVSTFTRENLQTAEFHMAKGDISHPQVVLFLSAVQSLCYMMCFRIASFTQEPGGLSSLLPGTGEDVGAEAFTPVLESPCQPLARIEPHVAKEFCRVIKPHRPQLSVTLRQQVRLPAAGEDVEVEEGCFQGEVAGLDAFFPFDPYRLRHSQMFLQGIYSNWVIATDDSESEMEPTGGFQVDPKPRASIASQPVTDDDVSDADFTDAADVAERGFIPSVGPSPAFRPRTSVDMADVSPPLLATLEGMDMDDFALPQAINVDMGPSDMLSSFLSTPAYKAAANRNEQQVAKAA